MPLAMERLYLACIVVSAVALVAITLVIPYGVFMRYVMNSASSWPEPFSVLAMVLFSFVGGAAAYRAGAHICVQMLTDAVAPAVRGVMLKLADLMMIATALFMLVYGHPAGAGDLGTDDRRVPDPLGRPHLLADPARRPVHPALHHRAALARRAAAELDRLPRPAARRIAGATT